MIMINASRSAASQVPLDFRISEHYFTTKQVNLSRLLKGGGVVEGERRSTKYFGRTPFPQIISGQWGNGDKIAFHQVGLQRNAKSLVKVNNYFIKVKFLISYVVICNVN